jgi:hypothetical protein
MIVKSEALTNLKRWKTASLIIQFVVSHCLRYYQSTTTLKVTPSRFLNLMYVGKCALFGINTFNSEMKMKLTAIIGITFIIVATITFMLTNQQSSGWSDIEISAFITACKGDGESAREESGLNESQVNSYCICIQKEVMNLYPEGSPLHQIDPEITEAIITDCYEKALSE